MSKKVGDASQQQKVKVTLYGSGKDVFPLDVGLLRRAERVLCLVEREQSGP